MNNAHPYPKTCPLCKKAGLKFPPVPLEYGGYRTGTYSCGSGIFDDEQRSTIDYCTNYGVQPNGRKSGVIRKNSY